LRGLIIAAGRGKRLSHIADLKPLVMVGNTPLLERILLSADKAGIDDFVVVTGYRSTEMKDFLEKLSEKRNFKIDVVYNDEWERENGLSVLKAKEHFRGEFVLLMSDHIFDASIIERISEFPLNEDEIVLAVDCRIEKNSLIDLEDVTKINKKNGLILDIGKSLKEYNAFDTGIFRCSPAVFSALEKSIEGGDSTLSGGIRALAKERKARVMDIGDSFWIDVDDDIALQKACRLCENMGEASFFSGSILKE